jgi:hypothetical protein
LNSTIADQSVSKEEEEEEEVGLVSGDGGETNPPARSQKMSRRQIVSLDSSTDSTKRKRASIINNRKKLNETKSSSSNKSASNNFSKSIDSCDSFKQKSPIGMGGTGGGVSGVGGGVNFAKSVDLERPPAEVVIDKSNSLIINNSNMFAPQRSIDYPCIVRKTPNLSDIVRKRLLFQKVSKASMLAGGGAGGGGGAGAGASGANGAGASGGGGAEAVSFSSSMEKEHVPKAPRKIIIRQDNSIEISLTRPPKLRRQTISEDFGPTGGVADGPGAAESNQLMLAKNPSMLSVSSVGNDRRKTIETCENIFLQSEESTKLRARTPPSNPHRILLYKDKTDKLVRSKSHIFFILFNIIGTIRAN